MFFNYFRPWIKSNHGDEVGQYPLSLLLKKYYQEFCKYSGVDIDDDDDEYYNSNDLVKIGKALIKKEQHKLPTLRPVSKFTEKYSRQIQSLLKFLNMPEWLTVSFEEYSPFKVMMTFNIDFPSMMKIGGVENISTYFDEFTEQLKNYMGIKVGSPSHGDLDIEKTISLNGVDEFSNPKFQKELKTQIKSLRMGHRDIRSIKITFSDKGMKVEINFGRSVGYYEKRDYMASIKDFLSTMYSEDKFRVVH